MCLANPREGATRATHLSPSPWDPADLFQETVELVPGLGTIGLVWGTCRGSWGFWSSLNGEAGTHREVERAGRD